MNGDTDSLTSLGLLNGGVNTMKLTLPSADDANVGVLDKEEHDLNDSVIINGTKSKKATLSARQMQAMDDTVEPKKMTILQKPSVPALKPTLVAGESSSCEKESLEKTSVSVESTVQVSPLVAAAGSSITDEVKQIPEFETGPLLDGAILNALSNQKDRLLLLRAEIEMEKFVTNPLMTRLPLAPPQFPSLMNSYQRLLLHRLADIFGIVREVDPMSELCTNSASLTASTSKTSVVVLVKTDNAKLPGFKLASIVPPADHSSFSSSISPLSASSLSRHQLAQATLPNSSALSPSGSPLPLSRASSQSSSPHPHKSKDPIFKILPRNQKRSASSSSSASPINGLTDEEGGGENRISVKGKGKSRKELTLEEREAAYKEARERIFKQDESAPLLSKLSNASASTSYPINAELHHNYANGQNFSSHYQEPYGETLLYGMQPALRPSAPSFDPTLSGRDYGPQFNGQNNFVAHQSDPRAQDQQQHQLMSQSSYRVQPDSFGSLQYDRPANPQYPQSTIRGVSGVDGRRYVHSQQPPIQITAPSPHSQPTSYSYMSAPNPNSGLPPVSNLQDRAQELVPPFPTAGSTVSAPPSTFVPWASGFGRPASIPSPALSNSSRGSSLSKQQGVPPNMDRAYAMRFPDGIVTGLSNLSFTGRSISSSTSASSSETSRTASSTNVRGGGSSDILSSSSMSLDQNPPFSSGASNSGLVRNDGRKASNRRNSQSTTYSVRSAVSSSVSDISKDGDRRATAAEEVKDSINHKELKTSVDNSPTSRRSSISGGEQAKVQVNGEVEKDHGKSILLNSADALLEKSSGNSSLHPSLPAKPAWVVNRSGPPGEQRKGDTLTGFSKNSSASENPFPYSARIGAYAADALMRHQQQIALQQDNKLATTISRPSHDPVPAPLPYSFLPSQDYARSVQQVPQYQPQHMIHPAAPGFVADFQNHAWGGYPVIPPPPPPPVSSNFVPSGFHRSISPSPYSYQMPHLPHHPQQANEAPVHYGNIRYQGGPAMYGDGHANGTLNHDLVDIPRPPPRNTELFDPNKPQARASPSLTRPVQVGVGGVEDSSKGDS